MFEHTAVALLLDVLEVIPRRSVGWIPLTHVAETARELGEPLAVRGLADPLHRQMAGFDELGAGEHGDLGLAENRGVRERHGREIG